MLYIGFALRNPWSRRHIIVADKSFRVSENKSVEIAVYKNNCIAEFSISISGFKQDHAGFSFDIGLFGYDFDFMFYDNRHYNER